MKNLISSLRKSKVNREISKVMEITQIKNKQHLRFVKDFNNKPHRFGFQIMFPFTKKSDFFKDIAKKVGTESKYFHLQLVMSVLREGILTELMYPVTKKHFGQDEDKYKDEIFDYHFTKQNSIAIIQYLVPVSNVNVLPSIMGEIDTFLSNLSTLVAERIIEKEEHRRKVLEMRETYVIEPCVPNDLVKELKDRNLLFFANEIYQESKNRVFFELTDIYDSDIPVGASKLGGRPDLINEESWPTENGKKLGLLAQINLREVKPYDKDDLLPSKGILSFFYDNEEMPWESDGKGMRVVYTKEDNLMRINAFDNLHDANKFRGVMLVPSSRLSFDLNTTIDFLDEQEMDRYFQFVEGKEGYETYLLGYPIQIQNDPLEDNYITMNTSNDQKDDWVLLFQLDSVQEANMMWGDCGRLYFLIHKEDLAKHDFSRVRVLLQCF